MLRSIEELEKYDIQATDGPIGQACDFFFDDDAWVVRYLVVDTGGWLLKRKVLISPISIGPLEPSKKKLDVLLGRDQIRRSPDIDSDMPVSRQQEMRYFNYYGYPCYWGGKGLWGEGSFPSLMVSDMDDRADGIADAALPLARVEHGRSREPGDERFSRGRQALAGADGSAIRKHDDPHLRSCKSVLAYEIQANDGLMGHVEGFLVDERTWAIRYLIVSTSYWWLGQKVLIVPNCISNINWCEGTVEVGLSRADIKNSMPLDAAQEPEGRQDAAASQTTRPRRLVQRTPPDKPPNAEVAATGAAQLSA
jgi:hypothetical protein